MTSGSTHYEVLGVALTDSAATIRRAFLDAAREHHPDRSGDDGARMRAVNHAWSVLGDPVRRRDYDRTLAQPPLASPPSDPPRDGPVRTEREDLLADLADDRPIGGVVRLPGWLSLIPPGMFALSILLGFGGLLFMNRALLAGAFVAFLASCVLFLVSPFVALLVSRSSTAAGPVDEGR